MLFNLGIQVRCTLSSFSPSSFTLNIPQGYYSIHLYDTTPYMITVGHIAVKLPCDSKSETPYKILIGQAPNLKPADFELIKELSKPGEMCIYHVDLKSQPGTANGTITDIAIQNPTDKEVKFGPTATVVIGVDEIMPGAEEGGAMSNMTTSNSTG